MPPETNYLAQLRLLQLADSALPIGTTAHSFGLETLVAEEILTVPQLEPFLQAHLAEVGQLEAVFCRASYYLAKQSEFEASWLNLNQRLSAFKPARESRIASATLGRRLLQLVVGLDNWPLIQTALQISRQAEGEIHHCAAFGLVGGVLELGQEATVLAYLQQSLGGLVSACQRLLPLGQSQASRILWNLKPHIVEIADLSQNYQPDSEELACFTPLLDLAAMRHPALHTRLFIS